MERFECKQCGAKNSSLAKYCSGCGYRLPESIAIVTEIPDSNINKPEKGIGKKIDTLSFRGTMEPFLTNNLMTSPDMKVFREHKTTLGYNYKDKNGVFVLKLLVSSQVLE
ncbi:zinc ribbon domain-containing protein [Maribacter cobaltidurans]|uniref:Uncharacterized protein n=1 Tax=Maribacter cobaltidurans TaxID=1178778 RepID=A0A223V3A5_9FLAO|nr:zinc ribbon domain-containing protein [Maribacter cobaltidurans]ASV29884.1 hypothetical protein CJ263_06420 [Maribacter cobaltidurans]GGD88943.1 hypothetical protein GCM10011412_28570 [Maribacter cobaltidurans]